MCDSYRWRAIETAPENDHALFYVEDDGVYLDCLDRDGALLAASGDERIFATHWMPLPKPPVAAAEKEAVGVEPRAYIVHAPEDDYYGTRPDRLQFHPLAQRDLDNGYRQTPLYEHPAVPDGYVLVPREEMTDAMMDAAQAYLDERSLRGRFTLPGTFNWHEFWQAMIAAAEKEAR